MNFGLTPKRKDQLGAVAIAAFTLFCMFKLVTYTPATKHAETAGDAAIQTELVLTVQQQQQRINSLESKLQTQDKSLKQLYDYIFQVADESVDDTEL